MNNMKYQFVLKLKYKEQSILSLINETYMKKAIMSMLQLLTCVQFIDFLGIFASHFQVLHVLLHVSSFS